MGEMKMGNIVPRVGIKTHISDILGQCLPLHHICFPDITYIPIATCLCGSLSQRLVQTTTYVMIMDKFYYEFLLALVKANGIFSTRADAVPDSRTLLAFIVF